MEALIERRKKRSCDPLVALHYQLTHARQDGGLEAIVVADLSGVVVAGAGAWALCEELAAYAPFLAHDTPGNDAKSSDPGFLQSPRMAALRDEVDVQPVEVDGQELLLCARRGVIGGRFRSAALERAAAGVSRILSAGGTTAS